MLNALFHFILHIVTTAVSFRRTVPLVTPMKGMAMLATVTVMLAFALQQSTGSKLLASVETNIPSVQNEIIGLINTIRRNVKPQAQNMLKMTWSEHAAASAEAWVRKCNFNHSPVKDRTLNETICSELLFKASYPASWTHIIRTWFKQEENFTYGVGEKFVDAQIGHYTQMVWARSNQMGCQVAFCGKAFIYSCIFCPAGNDYTRMGLPYEMGTTCKRCPNDCEDGLCTNPCPYTDKYVNCDEMKDDCEFDSLVREGCKATCQCTTEIK
ncbi:cysteine-rich venom protein-like [Ambystoma mexicanum]|uniref:cysteine-rich venom protein-like n=1 Tax=Ambystoma mexicanum TaxID=8296 RepID=UPI0037E74684